MTTIRINLPLVDARACTGCPLDSRLRWCALFRKQREPKYGDLVRLPECIAAEIEEVQP